MRWVYWSKGKEPDTFTKLVAPDTGVARYLLSLDRILHEGGRLFRRFNAIVIAKLNLEKLLAIEDGIYPLRSSGDSIKKKEVVSDTMNETTILTLTRKH